LNHLTFALLTDGNDSPASGCDLSLFNREGEVVIGTHAVPERLPAAVSLHFLDESLVRSAAAAKQVLLQQSIEAQDNVARRATYRQWSENAEAQ
jgi:hypothetical protein